MRSCLDEQGTDSLGSPPPRQAQDRPRGLEEGRQPPRSGAKLRPDGLPQTSGAMGLSAGQIQKRPRLSILPSQENGVRIKVIENGESSIFVPWSLWTKVVSLILVKPLALGQAQGNISSLCPATIVS